MLFVSFELLLLLLACGLGFAVSRIRFRGRRRPGWGVAVGAVLALPPAFALAAWTTFLFS
ncbi:hypothetical protein [Streptacidiphilus rugosus]|uniref:hypothetical protein n=1 Tax=Streptacidiphilus rugosus TaxID=405783 RepID=UPI00055D0ED0|nr:hypothetical protein [Streptacidiphilus rugosus]